MSELHLSPLLYPHQCRAARAVLRMSREKLADVSGVSVRTIAAFESPADHRLIPANLKAIRAALEQSGARFTDFGILTE